jgi:hypothetical protein
LDQRGFTVVEFAIEQNLTVNPIDGRGPFCSCVGSVYGAGGQVRAVVCVCFGEPNYRKIDMELIELIGGCQLHEEPVSCGRQASYFRNEPGNHSQLLWSGDRYSPGAAVFAGVFKCGFEFVFVRSNAEVVGSNLTRGKGVCVRLFCSVCG